MITPQQETALVKKLDAFHVEIPSWGLANTGTRFGKFIHRMSSPRHHVPKVYEVPVQHPLDERQVQKLLSGVVLDDDPQPVRAAACQFTSVVASRSISASATSNPRCAWAESPSPNAKSFPGIARSQPCGARPKR